MLGSMRPAISEQPLEKPRSVPRAGPRDDDSRNRAALASKAGPRRTGSRRPTGFELRRPPCSARHGALETRLDSRRPGHEPRREAAIGRGPEFGPSGHSTRSISTSQTRSEAEFEAGSEARDDRVSTQREDRTTDHGRRISSRTRSQRDQERMMPNGSAFSGQQQR